MNPYTLKVWVEIGSMVIGILAAIGFFKWFWPAIRRWCQPAVNVFSAIGKMPDMHQQLGAIAREVMPNGGSSLRDAVARVETKVDRVESRQLILEATARARSNSDPNLAMFECDTEGKNIEVSDTYCRWLNLSREDLLGWGFMSYVHPADRESVREEWQACLEERRVYSKRHKMMTSEGTVMEVDVSARPIPEVGPVQRWIGVIRKV